MTVSILVSFDLTRNLSLETRRRDINLVPLDSDTTLHSLVEKTGDCSSQLKSTFRHLPISSHTFFVTISPSHKRESL